MIHNDTATCTILTTSDLHGNIQPIDYRTGQSKSGGLAAIASLIQQEREKSPHVLLIDNGDLIQGTPLAYYAAAEVQNEINPGIAALNYLQYDAAVIGNHEFNFGQEFLMKAVQDSNFPWLSAGILNSEDLEPAFGKPYIIKWIQNEIKIAVLGVTTHYIPNWESPAHIQGLQFIDALESVKRMCTYIHAEERPDLLVVSYHGGLERDLLNGEATERITGENQAYAMCTEIEGIDILITGHQHRFMTGNLNGVTIIQPGSQGQALGRVTVTFQKENDRWSVHTKQAELLRVEKDTDIDPAVLQLSSSIEAKTQLWLNEVIGTTIGDLTITDADECRKADHPFIEFINKVQMEATGADISFTTLPDNDCEGFGPTITRRDILSNFIYPNTLTVLRLTGKDIRLALEQTAEYFQLDAEGRIIINPAYLEPKPQHYNYDMWEGIQYELHIARMPGERVHHLMYHGHPVEDTCEYDVVMNNYRSSGGGNYEIYKGKPLIKEVNLDMSELVTDYIQKYKQITAECDHNWRVI